MTLRWNFHSTAVTVFPCGLGLGQKTEGGFGFDAIRTSEQLIQLVEVFLNVPFERHLAVFFFLINHTFALVRVVDSPRRACQQRLAFPQGTQHRIYLVAGQNPTPMRQFGNDRPLEALIKVQRLFFIEEMVGQNCQCQLCRAAAAIKDIG